ncbi:CASC3/Barentsz eIF4AIII binding-domain-containing protein [Coniochaeta sp. 2T2.1]|nr:CASC3/Barentsz eIF4AIII binding-domain-containing protein [Coniochaeta sp. 2T2.1]
MAAEGPRRLRRKLIGARRRVEDEGEDEAGHDGLELDDDSLTEGSVGSDDHDPADDSDTSNVDDGSPTSPNVKKVGAKGHSKPAQTQRKAETVIPNQPLTADTDIMLNGLSISDKSGPVQEMDFDEVHGAKTGEETRETQPKPTGPVIVSSGSIAASQQPPFERRRREHEEYRKKRDEDPAFVPNRGAFFMHDHRHAGPAANGFRPFPRGGGGARGRGRGGLWAGFQPQVPSYSNPSDPITNSTWSHDMHEAVASPPPPRPARYPRVHDGPPSASHGIPTCPPSQTHINRIMATEKPLGTVQIRVFFPPLKTPISLPGLLIKQYTKLPDHRPPLRRDKPVRISLPGCEPRYIYPATDRSFIFIPRALRPNQQKMRGKARSGLGSIGGWSRRTSVFGGSYYGGAGSYYGGSTYSPSVAMSRRSSLAPDLGREFLVSPTGSAISRPPLPMDNLRPVVRLPPMMGQPPPTAPVSVGYAEASAGANAHDNSMGGTPAESSSINDLPQPQTHPLPQKPAFHENRPNSIPMHQPRPQKTVSVENIESPVQQHYQQAFHQQYPVQVSNGYGPETHMRHPSYPSQHSTGTPLSQIPERAIHAAPFQPNAFQQQHQPYYNQPYPQMMPPQQGYYYPTAYPGASPPNAGASAFVPGPQPQQNAGYPQQQQQQDPSGAQANGQGAPAPNLVAQEVNGMVYYYDATQLPAVPSYPAYAPPQAYVPGVMNMGGMVTPSPDAGFYYPPAPGGMVYYPQ